jgi:hypothetical protein
MIEYALGCATVGAVWLFWPRLDAWLSGEAAKVETQARAGVASLKQSAQADLDQLKEKL